MLQTYKAILRGNYLDWSGETPQQVEGENAVEVHVTLLEEPATSSVVSQGKRMAEALEKLAGIKALSAIDDPSAWQREQREERSLPDRDA